jgi:Fe2+ or Zn2+ uptake regulation protein
MRWKDPRIEESIVAILSAGRVLRGKELLEEVQRQLNREISRSTIYRYLRDLEARGVLEWAADGWRIKQHDPAQHAVQKRRYRMNVRQICVSLDDDIVKKIDEARGLATRSRFINHVLKMWFAQNQSSKCL